MHGLRTSSFARSRSSDLEIANHRLSNLFKDSLGFGNRASGQIGETFQSRGDILPLANPDLLALWKPRQDAHGGVEVTVHELDVPAEVSEFVAGQPSALGLGRREFPEISSQWLCVAFGEERREGSMENRVIQAPLQLISLERKVYRYRCYFRSRHFAPDHSSRLHDTVVQLRTPPEHRAAGACEIEKRSLSFLQFWTEPGQETSSYTTWHIGIESSTRT